MKLILESVQTLSVFTIEGRFRVAQCKRETSMVLALMSLLEVVLLPTVVLQDSPMGPLERYHSS
jgi:hypothetical protein